MVIVVVNLKGVFKSRDLAVLICASKVQPPRDDRCDSKYSDLVQHLDQSFWVCLCTKKYLRSSCKSSISLE